MKKEKNNKRSKKKILITVLIVLAVIAAALQVLVRPLVVNYAFGKITDTVIQTMGNSANQPQSSETAALKTEDSDGADGQEDEIGDGVTEDAAADAAEVEKRIEEVNNMSVNQVASVVASDSGLTSKLESIVSSSDKEKVLGILLSNFTKEEIAKYSAEVASGISSKRKSELAAMARSRLTSAQWAQCMQLFSKYVDQLRPVIVEKIKN